MTFQDIVRHRRAVRYYDAQQPIDAARVQECLQLAALAPTSSNMQLWHAYHITDRDTIARLAEACLGQSAVKTAQQLVVFTIEPSLYKLRSQQNYAFQEENVRRNYPQEKWEKYLNLHKTYYTKLMPFVYSRCFGLIGAVRKLLTCVIGCFRPIVRQVSEGEMTTVMHKSCALVVQTFMLAMSEAGYDTCPLEGFDSLRVKRILGLKGSTQINMIVSCGIRDKKRALGDRFRVDFNTLYTRV